jgi:hypothetical protein
MGLITKLRNKIMWAFVEKFLGLQWLGDLANKLNGNKTFLGLAALVVHMLNIVPTYLPQFGFTPELAGTLQQLLEFIGVMFPLGLAHKGAKLMAGKPQK